MEDLTFLEKVVEIFRMLPDYVEAIVILLTGIVTTATAVTMATPTKVDDEKLPIITKPLNAILKFINTLAGNIFKNKNADDE